MKIFQYWLHRTSTHAGAIGTETGLINSLKMENETDGKHLQSGLCSYSTAQVRSLTLTQESIGL
jgi:hypothetical protein